MMYMWMIIFFGTLSLLVAGVVWMSFAVGRFRSLQRRWPQKRWKRMLCGMAVVAAMMLALHLAFGLAGMVMALLHLLLTWLVCDVVAWMIKRLRRKTFQHYYAGVCAIVLTSIWLGIGYYNAHHVCRTEYNLTTHKPIGVPCMKIVALTDSHVGATFHWQEFEGYIDRINAERPDMVVVVGDFIDDDTSKEDMLRSCEALGRLRTHYGVFFVYGNHDEGYWPDEARAYTLSDLDSQLQAHRVRILRDETVRITPHLCLCGRLDKQRATHRQEAATLMSGIQPHDYVVCLDHEPNDYTAEAESGMDLVVSGHTHGGQFLGLGTLGVLMGANDAYYGYERRHRTDFIVSSGIGNWALPFKTGCIAEYVVVNLSSAQ